MQRFTVSLDDDLAELFDQFLHRFSYNNRSEAIRDLIRKKLETDGLEHSLDGHSVGTITYVYSHKERELATRLARIQHQHHDVLVSTLQVHLDHDHCLETLVTRGPTKELRAFSENLIAKPGIRHGQIYLLPVVCEVASHSHNGLSTSHEPHQHVHTHPAT